MGPPKAPNPQVDASILTKPLDASPVGAARVELDPAFLNYPLGAVMAQGERCGIKRAEPDSESRRGVYRTRRNGEVATCRFPLEWLAPTKRPIRWHVTTDWMFPEPASMIDRAPGGHGWYP